MRVVAKVAVSAFLVAFGASAASAQTATQDINITATVTKACTINNVATGTPGSATIPVSLAGAVNTAAITAGLTFANVACNAASNLQLTSLSGGVVNATAPTGIFTNIIDYTASATWNGQTAVLDTSSTGGAAGAEAGTAVAVGSAGSGNLAVSITPIANTAPLVIGTYNDTLRVTLTPQ